MIYAFIVLLAFQASAGQSSDENCIWKQTPLSKVTEIKLPPSALDGKWQVSPGLKVDDLSDLSGLSAASRNAAIDVAKQLKPIGVSSVADYSLVSTGFPLNTVTVRVFVFNDSSKCKAWWKKKYQHEGWEKSYSQDDSASARIVRSTQTNKSAMAFGNVWLTTHQLREGDEHITAANYVLKHLTNGAMSLPVKQSKKPDGDSPAPKASAKTKTEAHPENPLPRAH